MMANRFLIYRRAYPPKKNEDGNYLCRVCDKILPGRLRSFCSKPCRDDALIRCGIDVRSIVWQRDKSWCARCGLHVETLEKRIKEAWYRHREHKWSTLDPRWVRFLKRIGIDWNLDISKSLWEAHHKHAVKDGGRGACLEDYETLCVWCHKKASAEQHRRWAMARRDAKGQMMLG
jgi:hypothetical protein